MADFTAGNVLTAAQLDTAFNTFTINDETGTTYTLAASDAGEMVSIANNSGGTVTIPLNATVPFETGTHVHIVNAGTAGTYTIAGTGGVTLNGISTTLAIGAAATVYKTATNTWRVLPFSTGSAAAVLSGTTGSPATGTGKGGKALYTWTGNGSFTVGTAGRVRLLVVSGGAGAAASIGAAGDGGTIDDVEVDLPAGTYDIVVGAGGSYPGGSGGATTVIRSVPDGFALGNTPRNFNNNYGNDGRSTDATGRYCDISGSSVGFAGAGYNTFNPGTYDAAYGGCPNSATVPRANSGGGGSFAGSVGAGAAGRVELLV
jgi:hypothetical protein